MNGELVVVDDVPGEFAERVIEAFHGRPHDGFSLALSGGEHGPALLRAAGRRRRHARSTGGRSTSTGATSAACRSTTPTRTTASAREALLDRVGAANATYPMRCDEGADPYQLRLGELGQLRPRPPRPRPRRPHRLAVPRLRRRSTPTRAGWSCMNDDPLGDNPHPRMTLTFAGIARARLVLVTVAGEEKREALARVVAGDDVPGRPRPRRARSSGSPIGRRRTC